MDNETRVTSLLNVTDDRSHATDNSEYTSSSVETTTTAYLRRPKGIPESPDTGIPPPIDEELREAAIAYYTFFYSICPSLHPSTLLRKVVSDTLCPLLEAALRASTSVFVSRKLGRTVDTEALFSRLFSAITMRVEALTVDEMCAFQLASMGVSSGRGFVYFDTLKTSVSTLLLQLEWHELDRYDSPRQGQPMTWDEWVERETKRRVLWISYKVDAHHAGVVGCAPIFDANQFYLCAPCSDTEWDDLSLTMLLQGSGASDSDDIASTGEAQYKTVLAVMDSLSLLFKSPSPYESFVTQLVMLQRDAKTSWTQQKSLHLRTSSPGKEIARPRLLGESQLFQRLDTDLRDWRLKLVPAESLRDSTLSPHEVCFFGDIRHKTFLLRVRYACISIYAVGMGTILHLSNRPSFFADAERQTSPMDVEGASDTHKETLAVASMLGQKFGPMWSQGLLAQDVEPESWKYCVQGAHDMADTLRRNSDIPLEHFDMVIPFALFTSITVLLRHIGQSRHKLDTDSSPGLARRQREAEWKQCLRDIKVMWRVVHEMGLIWQNDVLSGVLKLMHIDDVISAADKLEPAPPKHLPSSIFS
ncbi:hypothetical protein GGI06_000262 [Coemansia sp. S85]|nr:hypothetical protein GGI06_000262 [Coemansia sp. S85]